MGRGAGEVEAVRGVVEGVDKEVERQKRQRLDGDDVGIDFQRRFLAAEFVFQRGADQVFLANRAGAGRTRRRDQQPVDDAGGLRIDGADAVDGRGSACSTGARAYSAFSLPKHTVNTIKAHPNTTKIRPPASGSYLSGKKIFSAVSNEQPLRHQLEPVAIMPIPINIATIPMVIGAFLSLIVFPTSDLFF
jgi:hypothetical protein